MPPAAVPLARTEADLTPSWLSGALGGSVIDVVRAPIGTGQMADTFRLDLTWDGPGGPPSLIAKVASRDEQSRGTGLAMRAYEVEVRSYQQLAPRIGTRLPRCHYAAIDTATGDFTVLLDDVSPATVGDDVAGCTPEVAAVALAELAALHAPCWQHPELAGLDWLNRSTPDLRAFTAALVGSVVPGFLDRYSDILGPEHSAVCELFGSRIGDWFSDTRGPRTACHGDFRTDNMLFPPDGGRPFVVDWQTASWSNPASDVAYFLGGSLPVPARQEHGSELIAGYHEALLRGGVTGYSLGDLTADIRWMSFAGLAMAIGASMLVARTDRGDVMFTTAAGRHVQQIIDLDAQELLG